MIDLTIVWQVLNSQTPLAWGIAISLVLVIWSVVSEVIKQIIGPMFRKSQHRHSDQLLERMCDILESNADLLKTIAHLVSTNEKTLERIEGKMP